MLELKLTHVSKRGHWSLRTQICLMTVMQYQYCAIYLFALHNNSTRISMVVADALVLIWHEDIRNNYDDAGRLLPIRNTTMYWHVNIMNHVNIWDKILIHFSDVIMGAMASRITGVSIVLSTVQVQIKENIKALRHWLLWGEFTGDRRILLTKGQ